MSPYPGLLGLTPEEDNVRLNDAVAYANRLPGAAYPGDSLQAPFGLIAPATAVRIVEGDANRYPVDAAGNELQWIRRPAAAPVYLDPTIDRLRPAMPGFLEMAGDMTAAPVGMAGAGMAAAARAGRVPGLISASGAGDDAARAASNAGPAKGLLEPAAATPPRQPNLLQRPDITGSMNPLDEVDFTYKGKNPGDWTPDDYAAVGNQFGVRNLGPESPGQTFKYADGGEFSVPGGLEGNFTYYDMLRLKAQGIDPSRIDRDLHTQIQQKILRTMTPEGGASDEQVFSGLIFGMTSPNNPLFPNQLAQSRLRLRDPQMLDELAGMINWKPGEAVDKEVRKPANDKIANAFGLDAASKGGLGVRGSTDYTRLAEFAQMFKQDPAFFRKAESEPWDQFVERVSSQVAGLSMKTGSFGSVWQDPAKAAISAIDRHMANEFEKTGGLFKDEAQRMGWEKRVVDRWNKANPEREVGSFYDLRKTPGTDGHIGGMLLEYVGDAKTPKFRTKITSGSNKGETQISPSLPDHLRNAKWVSEPETVFKMGDAYKRALEINDQRAREHGLGLFGSQWMEWDRIRRRLEPHENMFPGLERMPAMSKEQLKAVDAEHRMSGHKNYTKVDAQGRRLKGMTEEELAAMEGVYLQPTRPRSDPSRFGYFSAIPGVPLIGGLLDQNYREE